jgi:hypothetical protein
MIAESNGGGTMSSILGSRVAVSVFLAFLVGGCPKRQTVPLVVYVQPPPAGRTGAASNQAGGKAPPKETGASNQANTGAGPAEALVIEEPPPPPPEEPVVAPAPVPAAPAAPAPRHRARPREDVHQTEEQAEPTDSAVPATPAEVPSLEPRSDSVEKEDLQNQVQTQEDDIKRRIGELDKNAGLSSTERRTLKDATSFWLQSVAALRDRDLLRAQELAQKASLLLAALERR